jgi:hypothetical protein
VRDSGQAYNQHTKSYSRTEGSQRKGASSHIQVYTAYRKYSTTTRCASTRKESGVRTRGTIKQRAFMCVLSCLRCVFACGLSWVEILWAHFQEPFYLDFKISQTCRLNYLFTFLQKVLLASTFPPRRCVLSCRPPPRGASAPHAGHDDRLAQRQGVPRPFC